MKKSRNLLHYLWIAAMMGWLAPLPEARGASGENQVQAAFIYQITKYVTWPGEDSAGSQTKPFTVCIAGDSPIQQEFEKISKDRTVKNRPILVKKIDAPEFSKDCKIIFVATTSINTLEQYSTFARSKATLIITKIESGIAHGSMINFYVEEDRIRFEVSPKSIHKEGLDISSQLLKLARIVE